LDGREKWFEFSLNKKYFLSNYLKFKIM